MESDGNARNRQARVTDAHGCDTNPRTGCVNPSASPLKSSRTRTTSPITTVAGGSRSEEHTSELQSRLHLVCRLLLEKKKISPRAGSPREIDAGTASLPPP